MKIAIDMRSLASGSYSGVENYTLHLVNRLLAMDTQNRYVLFFNDFFKKKLPYNFKYINAKTVYSRYPSRILNLIFYFKILKLENIIGDFDILFMPNSNPIHYKKSAKLVLTVHDLSFIILPEFYDTKRQIWHKIASPLKLMKNADKIVAVSEFTKSEIIRMGISPEKNINVIYPAVDTDKFSEISDDEYLRRVRNKLLLPPRYVLFLNTIEPRKNLACLLKAFEIAKSDFHLVIAGRKGWKYKDEMDMIKNHPKKNFILVLDFVEEKDKPAVFGLASVFVYSSFYEGFGFQILEAFSAGVPVVASAYSSIPEVAQNAAIYINPYFPQNLAERLDMLMSGQIDVSAYERAAKERLKNFSWHESAKQILAIFNSFGVS